jgi:methyltransferase (TIGR00027 family)
MMAKTPAQGASTKGIQDGPSQTAAATAGMRAMAAHDPRQEMRCADTMAELFLTEEQRKPLQDLEVREWIMKTKVAPGAYEFMIARTAFFDQLVEEALTEGLRQLVLLGAGYDSRPYRFADRLGGISVFELDASPTQSRKQEMLRGAGVTIAPNVHFVPIDFSTDDLAQTLLHAGYAREGTCLFLWEGVTYYLTKEAVHRILTAVCSVAASGSRIAFDFASVSEETLSDDSIKKLRERVGASAPAEPAKFGIPAGMLESFLAARGFSVLRMMNHEQMEAKYLRLSDGSLVGHVPPLFNFAVAGVV